MNVNCICNSSDAVKWMWSKHWHQPRDEFKGKTPLWAPSKSFLWFFFIFEPLDRRRQSKATENLWRLCLRLPPYLLHLSYACPGAQVFKYLQLKFSLRLLLLLLFWRLYFPYRCLVRCLALSRFFLPVLACYFFIEPPILRPLLPSNPYPYWIFLVSSFLLSAPKWHFCLDSSRRSFSQRFLFASTIFLFCHYLFKFFTFFALRLHLLSPFLPLSSPLPYSRIRLALLSTLLPALPLFLLAFWIINQILDKFLSFADCS